MWFLGYGPHPVLSQPNIIGETPRFELRRKIGFYNEKGLLEEPLWYEIFKRTVHKINKTQ